jgi:general secretion pathway protein D
MILRVRPVINSGNRIDLDISQEVSNVKSLSSGAITSPTIGTRKVDTKLTLRDGSTVMLAGLISNDNSSSDAGVPLLKDIPGVGSLFKTETTNKNKKELIILITPYIINDDFEAESISNAFQSSLGDWAKDLKERTDLNALKRAPVNPENAKPGTEISAPVREPKLVRPVKEVTSAPEQQEPAPATSAEPSAAMPEAPAKDAPKKSDTEELGGVIMSKPVPAPVQNPASATSAAGQDKSATKPAAKSAPVNKPSNTVMPPIPGAKVVDDPDLLEELRRAAGLPKR